MKKTKNKLRRRDADVSWACHYEATCDTVRTPPKASKSFFSSTTHPSLRRFSLHFFFVCVKLVLFIFLFWPPIESHSFFFLTEAEKLLIGIFHVSGVMVMTFQLELFHSLKRKQTHKSAKGRNWKSRSRLNCFCFVFVFIWLLERKRSTGGKGRDDGCEFSAPFLRRRTIGTERRLYIYVRECILNLLFVYLFKFLKNKESKHVWSMWPASTFRLVFISYLLCGDDVVLMTSSRDGPVLFK